MKSTITINDVSKTPSRIDEINKWLSGLYCSQEFHHIQLNGILWIENAYVVRLFFPKLVSLVLDLSSLSYATLRILLETVNADLSTLSIRTRFIGDISKNDSDSIINSIMSFSGLESIQLHLGFVKNEEMSSATLKFWAKFFSCLSVKMFTLIDIKLNNSPPNKGFVASVFDTGIISNSSSFLALLRIKVSEDTVGVTGKLIKCIVDQIHQCKYIESLEFLIPVFGKAECEMMDKLEINENITQLALYGYDGFRIDEIPVENIRKLCIEGKLRRTRRKKEDEAFFDRLCNDKMTFIRIPMYVDKAHVLKALSKNLFLKIFHVAPNSAECSVLLFKANQILKENGFRITIIILWMNQSQFLAVTNRELYLVMKKNAGRIIALLGYFL